MSSWSSNDWSTGEPIAPLGSDSEWRLDAMVVIPCRNGHERLQAVVESLAKQTYPTTLFSVVVVDDGSVPPLEPDVPDGLSVTVVRPWETSAGAAAARATGAVGESDVFVFLDADMIPQASWLEAHMRWHHVRSDAAVVGWRRHVEITAVAPEAVAEVNDVSALFESVEFFEPSWLEDGWRSSDDGRRDAGELWRLISSGNLSVASGLYERSGGFDPDYWSEWGGEDNDLGYRLVVGGGLIIPEREAVAWHLGLGTSHDVRADAQRERSRLRLAARVPSDLLPRLTSIAPETPDYSVVIRDSGGNIHSLVSLIDGLLDALGSRVGLTVAIPDGHPERELLDLLLAFDARVEVRDANVPISRRWQLAPINGWIDAAAWTAQQCAKAIRSLSEGGVGELRVVEESREVGRFVLTRLESMIGSNGSLSGSSVPVTRTSSVEEWI